MIRTPVMAIMILLLLAMIAGLAGNFYLSNQGTHVQSSYLAYANQIKTLSQEVAKHAVSASRGEAGAFPLLNASKNNLDSVSADLNDGDPRANLPPSPAGSTAQLNRVRSLWSEMKVNVDIITAQQDSIVVLRDISVDLSDEPSY